MNYFLFFITFLCYNQVYSQRCINGSVVEFNTKKSLVGCSIYNINTQMGTIANENGEFKINANSGDLIQFSYIGMEIVEVYITATTDTLNIQMKYQVRRLKNVNITAENTNKKSVLYNPEYEKKKKEIKQTKRIEDPKKYSDPMVFLQSPITGLYYAFAPRERLKLVYLEKIQKRDQANLKYSYPFISMITKEDDEDELRKIKAHCYFSEDQILQSDYYQLGLMIKECYIDYLEKKQAKH